ncbi:MAG: 3-oxoacid CoA-transferase subunit A [Tissierellia bacterium]|nr:3-oxoacid CoA-transferase subunit A [Tissierellia bacterium]
MSKVIEKEKALDLFQDGQTILFGGFLNAGSANELLQYVADNKELKDLTIIGNDAHFGDREGIASFTAKKYVKRVITSYIGSDRELGRQMNAGETEVVLVPQGTLAERIRAGGFGLGGVLTPTGVGLEEIEEGKEIIEVDGRKFLLEKPIVGDIAVINCAQADTYGNLVFTGMTRNFNELMAFAAPTVIVQADEVVEPGELDPERISVPGAVVTHIVDGSKF